MMRVSLAAITLLGALAGTSCASAPPGAETLAPQAPLCAPGVELGKVVVAPLTRWRPDQKEPAVREAIALRAIEAVMPGMSCASSLKVLPVTTNAEEAAGLALARSEGATTLLVVRIDELGPVMIVSFPALWSTWSDVKFTLEAIDVKTGASLRAIPHHRQKGGAFESRGLEPLQGEMEQALRDVIGAAR